MVVNLGPIFDHLPAWAMVLVRLTGIFVLAPVFGSRAVPVPIKIFFAVGLSFCVYPVLYQPGTPAAELMASLRIEGLSLWKVIPAVCMELMIGFVIGFSVSMPLFGLQMGARMIDMQMGLGVAGLFNPELGEESGILSEFMFISALAIFVIVGGHYAVLATLIDSFGHVPIGGFRPDGHMLDLVVGLVSSMFEMTLRVSAPLLCLIFLETVALGFIAKTVPQMNVLSIGFAIRIVAALTMLIGGVTVLFAVYRHELFEALDAVRIFFTTNP